MLLFETGRSTGEVYRWPACWQGTPSGRRVRIPVHELAELACAGGWPGNQSRSLPQAVRTNRDYLSKLQRVEVQRLEDK